MGYNEEILDSCKGNNIQEEFNDLEKGLWDNFKWNKQAIKLYIYIIILTM